MKNYDREQLAELLAIAPIHPFGQGDLTEDGVQYSAEVSTSSADYTTVESIVVDFDIGANIYEIEFGLTLALKSSAAAKDCKFKWQARNKFGTWVDLHTEITYAADASAYKEYTMSGRFVPVANFGKLPFEVRVQIKRETADENVTAKVKNSSYILVILNPVEIVGN